MADETGCVELASDGIALRRRDGQRDASDVEPPAAWRWPGNVRELENRVKRAVIMADARLVTAADLDLAAPVDPAGLNLRAAREAADRRAIGQALAQADGNISGAARLLGISRPTLYDLLKAHDLTA